MRPDLRQGTAADRNPLLTGVEHDANCLCVWCYTVDHPETCRCWACESRRLYFWPPPPPAVRSVSSSEVARYIERLAKAGMTHREIGAAGISTGSVSKARQPGRRIKEKTAEAILAVQSPESARVET